MNAKKRRGEHNHAKRKKTPHMKRRATIGE
jgi:hypothetical protein